MISTFNVYYNLIDTNYHIIALYTVEWVYTANQLLAMPPWTPEYMCGTQAGSNGLKRAPRGFSFYLEDHYKPARAYQSLLDLAVAVAKSFSRVPGILNPLYLF